MTVPEVDTEQNETWKLKPDRTKAKICVFVKKLILVIVAKFFAKELIWG